MIVRGERLCSAAVREQDFFINNTGNLDRRILCANACYSQTRTAQLILLFSCQIFFKSAKHERIEIPTPHRKTEDWGRWKRHPNLERGSFCGRAAVPLSSKRSVHCASSCLLPTSLLDYAHHPSASPHSPHPSLLASMALGACYFHRELESMSILVHDCGGVYDCECSPS